MLVFHCFGVSLLFHTLLIISRSFIKSSLLPNFKDSMHIELSIPVALLFLQYLSTVINSDKVKSVVSIGKLSFAGDMLHCEFSEGTFRRVLK